MKKRRLALLALVLTMVLITAFPMTAYAAETVNRIGSRGEWQDLSRTAFPITDEPLFIDVLTIRYTTSGSTLSNVEVDGVSVTPQIINCRYYQVVPGVYRYEQTFQIDVTRIVRQGTDRSLITFATGNSMYGIHVTWKAG